MCVTSFDLEIDNENMTFRSGLPKANTPTTSEKPITSPNEGNLESTGERGRAVRIKGLFLVETA